MTEQNHESESNRAGNTEEIEIVTPGSSLVPIDYAEGKATILNLHKVSGVNIEIGPGLDTSVVSSVFFEIINGQEESYTDCFIRFPIDSTGRSLMISMAEANVIGYWLGRADMQSVFKSSHREDALVAEQLVGRLLIRQTSEEADTEDEKGPSYLLRHDIPMANFDNPAILFQAKTLRSPQFCGELDKESKAGNDELLEQVTDRTKYIIEGHNQRRVVSRLTLAMIDAGIQIAQLTGLESIPMSGLLAAIYDPENFWEDELDEPLYISDRSLPITRRRVLAGIVDTWTSEMSIEPDSALNNTDILAVMSIREINLVALVEDYGHVTGVEKLSSTSTSTALVAGWSSSKVEISMTGSELLAHLNEQDRQNIEAYAGLILMAVESNLSIASSAAGIIQSLVESNVITHEVASVHSEEFGELVSQYIHLANAKQSMQESGVDVTSIEEALQAKLVEFLVRNEQAIRHTQMLAPELGINFDKLLDIIEKTRLKDRPLSEITQIIGRVVTAQERVIQSTFPALIRGVRKSVAEELGVKLLNPGSSWLDRTGATLFMSSEKEVKQVYEYVKKVLEEADISKKVISITADYENTSITIGDSELRKTIPEEDWLPKGPPIYTVTRGH